MLPFSKRKKPEEIELGDDDIIVLEQAEEEAVEIDVSDLELRHRLPKVTPPPPKLALRRLVTGVREDRFEDDVADECLKSIAAATSRARLSDSFPASIVPPIVPPAPRLPQFEISDADETTRRPAISSSSSFPVARDSVPGVLTVPAPVASTPFARTSSAALPAASSVAPVSMNSATTVDPTVILVRQPPKTGWIVAAALLGAACALLGMHFMAKPAEAPPAPATIVVTSPPPPAVTPTATTTVPATPAPVATVKFNEDQGVAVIAPVSPVNPPKPTLTVASVKPVTPPPAKTVAAKPAGSLGPKLPDGSLSLGARAPEPTKAAAKTAEPEPAPPPANAGSKKKLTPEQELAEAQLKASMK